MFKRTFSKLIENLKINHYNIDIIMNIIKLGNYIKKSTINSETKEIINIRYFDEDTEDWVTSDNIHISESNLINNYQYLDTGFKYTNSNLITSHKPLKLGDLTFEGLRDISEDENYDNDFQLKPEKPLDSGPVQIKDITEYHNKSEEEILFDSIIRKSKLTEEKITNFKPTTVKPKLNQLSLNIQLDFDSDMLINSCEFLDININKFGEYLTDKILQDIQFKRKLKESILSNLEPKLIITDEKTNDKFEKQVDDLIDSINKKYI
nr:MAG TPA: hypothetical protein [Caudoviricetes sp.]